VSVLLNSTSGGSSTGITTIGNISVATQAAAMAAQGTIDSILDSVNVTEGIIGSVMSRFSTAMANLQVSADNFKAAEGRIIDADVAVETSQLTREQILQQAGAAVLAQANQEPALALKLL
jgi:flagellin